MCVKEFLGYICGHCSIPSLRPCPLSTSNPTFPTCELPAERPIFTNKFCHPCSRIVWNNNVLRDEEIHREQHLAGECLCEVIFDGEDRERRLPARTVKEKEKQVTKEDYEDQKPEEPGRARNASHDKDQGCVGHEISRGCTSACDGALHQGNTGAEIVESRDQVFGVGVNHGYAYQGYFGSEMNIGGNFPGYENAEQGAYGIKGHCSGPRLEGGSTGGSKSIMSGVAGFDIHTGLQEEPGISRQDWDPAATHAAFQYVGYATNPDLQRYEMPSSEYGTLGRVNYPNHSVWQGQAMLGQPGAGMKWYPESAQCASRSNEKAQKPSEISDEEGTETAAGSRARSEPGYRSYETYTGSVVKNSREVMKPKVVSSAMAEHHP